MERAMEPIRTFGRAELKKKKKGRKGRKDEAAVPEDLGTVVVVLHGVLHKAEAVDVAHVRVSVGPEEVEAADGLLRWGRGRGR